MSQSDWYNTHSASILFDSRNLERHSMQPCWMFSLTGLASPFACALGSQMIFSIAAETHSQFKQQVFLFSLCLGHELRALIKIMLYCCTKWTLVGVLVITLFFFTFSRQRLHLSTLVFRSFSCIHRVAEALRFLFDELHEVSECCINFLLLSDLSNTGIPPVLQVNWQRQLNATYG